jgi:Ribosomal protein L11 methyltransferase (PrmA)
MSDDSARTLSYHARLLADRTRVDAFRRAMEATVKPGDVVIDVGAGTGVLAALACQAGASRVYAIEQGPIAGLTADLLSASGYGDRVEVVHCHSSQFRPDEKADVLVSETLWNFGLGEELPTFVRDLRARVLKPSARIVPERFRMMVAPVSRVLADWTEAVGGLDVGPARELAVNNVFVDAMEPGALLAAGLPIVEIDLTAHEIAANVSGQVGWTIAAPVTVGGLCGWFEADLAPGVALANPPGSGSSWSPVLLPVDPPLSVGAGQRLDAQLEFLADGWDTRWRVEAGGEIRSHATFRGRLLEPGWVRRRTSSARLELSESGRATAAALQAFAGGATVAQVRRLLADDHDRAFATEGDRDAFLSGLTARYCR